MLRGSIPVNSSEYFLENDATKGRTTSGSFSDWICSNVNGQTPLNKRSPEKKKRKEGYNVFEKLEHEIEVRVDAEENELSDKSQHHALLHQSRALLILLFLLWEHKDLQQRHQASLRRCCFGGSFFWRKKTFWSVGKSVLVNSTYRWWRSEEMCTAASISAAVLNLFSLMETTAARESGSEKKRKKKKKQWRIAVFTFCNIFRELQLLQFLDKWLTLLVRDLF